MDRLQAHQEAGRSWMEASEKISLREMAWRNGGMLSEQRFKPVD